MIIQDFNIQPRAYDILEAKKNSENPEKFFDEACDNSIQYGAKTISTEINEQDNSVLVEDNGNGFASFEAFKAFHQPYHIPLKLGISRYGIGGKIFKTLSDKRIVFSIGMCENDPNQKKVYFSFWNTSTPEKTDKPIIFYFNLGDTPPEAIEILRKYNLLCRFNDCLSRGTTGTTVCLVEIDTERIKNFFRTWSKMYAKVKASFFERYHLLIIEQGTEITVQYINNKGNSDSPTSISGYDPRFNINKSLSGGRPFQKTIGATQVYSWVKNEAQIKLKSRGIHFYRDSIKIATIPFVKRHGTNANDFVDLDTSKRMYRMNLESQIIMIRNNSDLEFNLGETKDKISLPNRIGIIAADEMNSIIKIVEEDRKHRVKSTIDTDSKAIKVSVPSIQMELESPQSFIKTDNGFEIVHGSALHEVLSSTDKNARNLFISLFDCMSAVYTEKTEPSEKANLTRTINRIGQLLETKL